MAFCKKLQPRIKGLLRLLENKAVIAITEAVEEFGKGMIILVESDGVSRIVEATQSMSDNQLRDAILKASHNLVLTSVLMKECAAIEDRDARFNCYKNAARQFDKDVWKHEIGLHGAKVLQEVLLKLHGINIRISEAKVLLEGFISTKK